MTDVMLAQPPGGRGDVISAILNDYATPRDSYDEQELMGNDVPELPAKDENPPESLRLNKPLPPMGRRLREAQGRYHPISHVPESQVEMAQDGEPT